MHDTLERKFFWCSYDELGCVNKYLRIDNLILNNVMSEINFKGYVGVQGLVEHKCLNRLDCDIICGRIINMFVKFG